MTYRLDCKDETEYSEALSVLDYYGFDIKYDGVYNNTSYNVFFVNMDSLEALFTHENGGKTSKSSPLITLYEFEDMCLEQLKKL